MDVKKGYTQTDIGSIPNDWEFKPIQSEIDLLTGYPFPSSKYSKSGIRLLRGSNVKRNVTDWSDDITQYWEKLTPELNQYILEDGDIVIAMDGSLVGRSFARLSKNDLPALLLQRVARVRSNKIDNGYLKEFLCSEYFTKYCDKVKTSSAIPHISPVDIRSFSIPIPPTKAEQTAIATALSDTDALISSLEKLIAKKRNIKQGAMQELLKPKKGWEVRMISEVVDSIIDYRGVTPKKLGMDWGGGKILALSANNVQMGYIDYEKDCYFGNEDLYKRWMRNGDCSKGDILMTMEAPLGNIASIPDDNKYILSQRTILIKTSSIISKSFLRHLMMHTVFQKQLLENASGTTAQGIQRKRLEKIKIEFPKTKVEQEEIANMLSDMDTEITGLEYKLEKYKQIKSGMMQNLLTGKIRLV